MNDVAFDVERWGTTGSTHTTTPKDFMEDMRSLEVAGVGSRALPNGLRPGPGQRSFQELYDEKYFTKDQAPPRPQPQQQPSSKGGLRNVLTRPGMPPTMSSSLSNNGTEDKKKKKRGFF